MKKEDYFTDRDKRRSVKDIVALLSAVKELKIVDAAALSRCMKFRNIVAHEYLDIRWSSINKFISETETL